MGVGLVKVLNNTQLDRIENEKQEANSPVVTKPNVHELAGYVRAFFINAKYARLEVEQKMLAILEQIKGVYDPRKLAAIKAYGGSDDFIRLTQHKIRDTEAWIVDMTNPYGDATWSIEPTPIADIPADVLYEMKSKLRKRLLQQTIDAATMQGIQFNTEMLMQKMASIEKLVTEEVKKESQEYAKQRAANMQRKILDQLEEGNWNESLRACINDLSRLKSCILKGPIFKRVPTLSWEQEDSGNWKVIVDIKTTPMFNRVSPFDWFPSAKSNNISQGDIIELEHISVSDLEEVVDLPRYNSLVIRNILRDFPTGYKEDMSVDISRQQLEKDNVVSDAAVNVTYDMLNYWGKVKGELLIKSGMVSDNVNVILPNKYYSINIKTINDQTIKEPTINPDPLGNKPYSVTSFIKSNDSQWGDCPAELMTDIQSICNAAVRALINNIAISSGPLVEEDVDRLAEGETGKIWPYKTILTTNKKMAIGPAVRFYQAKLLAGELLATYEKFKKEADDLVVPAYGPGNLGGAGRTSSGLAMSMSASARNIKLAVHNIDQDMTLPAVKRLFNFNMIYSADNSIKGDIHVKARGISGVIAKEQLAIRRNEFRATLRPVDEQLIGSAGLAYILRKNIESLDMDVDKAMPGYADLEKQNALTPPPVPPGETKGPTMGLPKTKMLDVAGQPAGGQTETSYFRDTKNA